MNNLFCMQELQDGLFQEFGNQLRTAITGVTIQVLIYRQIIIPMT